MRPEVAEQFMAEPAEVGVDPGKVAVLLARARQEVDEGLLPATQVALAKNGKLVCFETFGDADNESLFCIFSATKAITSAAAWLLIQEGKLDVSRKVVEVVPEFGTNGKQDIVIEQLFTHTAGFPHAPFRPTDWLDRDTRLARFAQWTLNWPVGDRFEYHPTSSMWVIAEIIERLSGTAFDVFVRERIAEPLGLPDLWVGLPASEHARVIDCIHAGDPMSSAEYAELGIPEPPVTEVTEEVILSFNRPEIRQVPTPGGGGVMSAAELALFYQALITGKSHTGETIWTEQILNDARRVLTDGYVDLLSGVPVNRALGVVIAGDAQRNMRGFGHSNSPLAFGHGGAGGQIAWADPETGISLGYCTNAHDRHPLRQGRRGVSISNRASDC
jgi:CubicO group peptidase (beta-lactamase class C family)